MKKGAFYIIFHANLAFSSIEEEDLASVIKQCYFPLLEIAQSTQTKIALELSGYTIEKICALSPDWLKRLKSLMDNGIIELIGSGYQQIIGPLAPYLVNKRNQELGVSLYKKFFKRVPRVAFLNEQTFSTSMVDLYSRYYDALLVEWNNPFSINVHKWSEDFGFSPVIAKGIKKTLPIIWTNSILFQQFQRTAHNQNTLEDYLNTIRRFIDKGYKCIPIYTSDLEIFNYRPRRFHTESAISQDEWANIEKILVSLKTLGDFYSPSEILDQHLNKSIILNLTNASHPIIVKKQTKYSLSRWSASGKGASYINALCYSYFQNIKHSGTTAQWKKLLKYSASDYRTHITEKKWQKAINFLQKFELKPINFLKAQKLPLNNDKKINIKLGNYEFIFLSNKGLALESIYKDSRKLPFGSVNHGDLDLISHGADYYSGTSTIESSQIGKLSNLENATHIELKQINDSCLALCGEVLISNIAKEKKTWLIDVKKRKLTLLIELFLEKPLKASIRLGSFTLLPVSKTKLFWYACKNGGPYFEKFFIDNDTEILQHQAVSVLQSARGGLGASDGVILLGIKRKIITRLDLDRNLCSPLVILQNSPDYDKHLTRIFFGVQEIDDTLMPTRTYFNLQYSILL